MKLRGGEKIEVTDLEACPDLAVDYIIHVSHPSYQFSIPHHRHISA
jgi:hypothetical protein